MRRKSSGREGFRFDAVPPAHRHVACGGRNECPVLQERRAGPEGGRSEQLLGLLQQRYGYARDKAEEEYRRFTERWAREEAAAGRRETRR